ncbi:FtsH-binding integral membrane protein [Nocardioides luteus]|uniref:ATP synthase protein I n=1 Tax=Nocardioides luteus TaxID=1844 RepID=A0ABQ5SWW8_9ACTN|nr:hypothetical protein [Nocardioides luteus]MDR7311756.1 FtsH-binding integral membrane protein [Nocardioides luteus]GGR66165.1 hypothetical protein GCM10010197_37140 [Nocardioides luteus]GLJ67997.1 hypothetical protein GCM10017579_20330 [Nocardioides luteus]
MTTATSKSKVLRGSAAVSAIAVLAALAVAFLISGSSGLAGAAIGSIATVVVLAAGSWTMFSIAAKSPTMSLPAAVGIFTLSGMVLFVVLLVVSKTGGDAVVRPAAFSVMALTVAWTTTFAFLVRRERIPLFDLPGADS